MPGVYTGHMTTIQVRIDEKTKRQARKVFSDVGLDMSSGIKLYLTRVAKEKAIPVSLHVPNAETRRAIKEARARKNLEVFETVEEWAKAMGIT